MSGIDFALSYDDFIFTATSLLEIKLKAVSIRRVVEANLGQFRTKMVECNINIVDTVIANLAF